MKRGFLPGRFMPPHAGHVVLCETARQMVDELTILVCCLPDDPIPGAQRLAWMRELFPGCRIVGHDPVVPQSPDEHPDFRPMWRAIVKQAHPEPIDVLFAGENFGAHLAAEAGAQFVLIGPRVYPDLSGSAVRADPWAHWAGLPAPVRAHFAQRICLHGPESTGKTALAAPLAAHFETIWTPEYGRVHCEVHGYELDAAGLLTIARTQDAMIRASLPWCNRRLIVDTDALTTAAWSIMLLGHVPDSMVEACCPIDLYLLTDTDVPWEDDGTRYFPQPEARQRFMQACIDVLDRAGANWVLISGSLEERLETAVTAIERLGRPRCE